MKERLRKKFEQFVLEIKKEREEYGNVNVDIITPECTATTLIDLENIEVHENSIEFIKGDGSYFNFNFENLDLITIDDICTHKCWEFIFLKRNMNITFYL